MRDMWPTAAGGQCPPCNSMRPRTCTTRLQPPRTRIAKRLTTCRTAAFSHHDRLLRRAGTARRLLASVLPSAVGGRRPPPSGPFVSTARRRAVPALQQQLRAMPLDPSFAGGQFPPCNSMRPAYLRYPAATTANAHRQTLDHLPDCGVHPTATGCSVGRALPAGSWPPSCQVQSADAARRPQDLSSRLHGGGQCPPCHSSCLPCPLTQASRANSARPTTAADALRNHAWRVCVGADAKSLCALAWFPA